MTKYFCSNCKADSEFGAEFGEWSGVVACHSCKTMGDKAEFVVAGSVGSGLAKHVVTNGDAKRSGGDFATIAQLEMLRKAMSWQERYARDLQKIIVALAKRTDAIEDAFLSDENMTEPKFAIAIGKVYEEIERLGDRIDKVQYAYDE